MIKMYWIIMNVNMFNSMYLYEVEENELLIIVNNLKSKKSSDCDDIDMCTVKRVIKEIVQPLTYICNLSFSTGVFPDKMKIAKVIPLFKSGADDNFSNYRPVSLLPQLSKILEKLFNNRMEKFIEKYHLMHASQYGFRTNTSTSMAILEFLEEVTSSLDKKKTTIGVFIDLKKTFDTIDHTLLLKKLHCYGIRGLVNTWIKSYLTERKQYVNVDNCSSDIKNVLCGIPQGSIIGPKLFTLYINDICNVSKLLRFILFADDTNIFYSGNDLDIMCKLLSDELEKLHVWFCVNKLSLNVNKTKYMIFSNVKHKQNSELRIQNVYIEKVPSIRFLGVIIDQQLNWKEHINSVKAKLSRSIGIIYRASVSLDVKSLRILYCSLCLPYLNYCVEVWGNTYSTNILPIVILQKKVLRVINKVHRLEHSDSLFSKSNLLKFNDIIKLKTCMILYKAVNKSLPKNLQKHYNEIVPVYNTRNKFILKYARTTLKSMCVSIKGSKLWNAICDKLKSCKNVYTFKKIYTRKLLEKYCM